MISKIEYILIESLWLLIHYMHCSQPFKMHKQMRIDSFFLMTRFCCCCRFYYYYGDNNRKCKHSSIQKFIRHSWRSNRKSVYFTPSLSIHSQLIEWLFIDFVCSFAIVRFFCFFLSRILVLFCRFVDFWNCFKFSLIRFGGTPNRIQNMNMDSKYYSHANKQTNE